MSKQPKSIRQLVCSNQTRDIANLSSEGKIFAELLMLIIDIKYRHRYGKSLADQPSESYSDDVQAKNVLPDHVIPVDDGLVGH